MKVCNRCGQTKGLDEFAARSGKKQPWCRECNRAYARQYYRDQPKVKQDLMRLRGERQAINEKFVLDYLRSHPCMDCGESDPVVLEFDHVHGTKRNLVSTLAHQG